MKRRTVVAIFSLLMLAFLLYAQESEQPDIPEGFVLVEAGTFQMGSRAVPEADGQNNVTIFHGHGEGLKSGKPVHSVTLTKSFYMSEYEVTQKQWQEVMGTNPSHFKGDNRPVEKVTWYDAIEFCNRLSRNEGLNPCYSGGGDEVECDFSANGYRLPTEAEWEYAARGGNRSQGYYFAGGNSVDDVGWYEANSGNETHVVGQKKANELGLYDMSGNVWEYCWDWNDKYSSSPQTDPRGPSEGGNRVGRGGSWNYEAEYMLVATRLYFSPSSKYNFGLGLRLVRTVE